MSDISSRAPDLPYPPESDPLYEPPVQSTTYSTVGSDYGTGGSEYSTGGSDQSTAKQVAGQGAQAAGQAAAEVKDTAKEQAQRVGSEAKTQARNVASDVRDRVSEQARSQNDKLVGTIRQAADQLDEMRGDRGDSPAATVVSRVADSGRQLADYLDHHGPEGVLREVQDFARRRPGAFLATALVSGFVVGRLGKGIAKADPNAGADKPSTDSFVSNRSSTDYSTTDYASTTGYPATTGYPEGTGYVAGTTYPDTSTGYAPGTTGVTEYAATGTGTPAVVDEQYATGQEYAPGEYPGGRQ